MDNDTYRLAEIDTHLRVHYPTLSAKMKASTGYAKIVEWSKKDQCYLGSVSGLVSGGCHGKDEKAVFGELCQIVGDRSLSERRQTAASLHLRAGLCQHDATHCRIGVPSTRFLGSNGLQVDRS